jgi:cell division septum initiation protein DivIVA
MEFEIGNFEISIIMERKEMETICEKLFKVLETNLRYLSEKYNDVVSEVLLIGGSTRIPKVQEIVKNAFPRAIINKTLNADEAVARGAATYATSLAGMIKKLNVIDHVPWDNESVKRAQKMEYIIDPKGIVQKKVCEYADLVEIKYENEKNEIEKLFERKKQLASQKSVEKVENSSQIVRDAEKLLAAKNNQDLQKYAKQITNLLERASIEYHLSNISNGNDHLEKLKTRVPRIQIYLRMLETTKKCSLKGFKKEASEIEKISGYLQDYCLDFADDVFRAYKVYLETCNYWLDLKDKIEEFEKKQTSKTKGTLLNIKKATTDVKTSLKSFERHAVAIVVDNKYIEELIEKFNTELQEHNLNQQLTIC